MSEAEFGFRVEEAVDAVMRAFGPPDWRGGSECDGERVRLRLDSGQASIVLELDPLPDRSIGPTVRLPRCRIRIRIEAAGATGRTLYDRLRLALHRGGG